MLLRGVRFAPPALDQGDISAVRNKSRFNGRGGFRPNNGGGRGGNQYNQYTAPRPGMNDRANPFAAHLDPSFVPPPQGGAGGWAPPAGGAGYSRGPPPPPRGGSYGYQNQPQGYNQPGYYGQDNSYQRGQNQYGYSAPPVDYNQQGYYNAPRGGGNNRGDSRGYNNNRGGYQSQGRGGYNSRRNDGYDRY